jgi:hypothetical protein
MMILPLSPNACALVTTMVLTVTFYAGRWCEIKTLMDFMEREISNNDD